MARTVDPSEVLGQRMGRGPLTDWSAYCDGQGHELKRGEDWDAHISPHSKRSSFRQWAKRSGYDTQRVHTTVPDDDTLFIYVEGGDAAKVAG